MGKLREAYRSLRDWEDSVVPPSFYDRLYDRARVVAAWTVVGVFIIAALIRSIS